MFTPTLLAMLAVSSGAAPPPQPAEILIPYRLTETKHVLVRVKINGKGPFNLIVDTGAPPVLILKDAAKKAGIKTKADGWAKLESFELEGGLVVPDVRTRVTDFPQAVGMNAMGLAGAELHGVIGYDVLARYRVTYDFNSDKLKLVPLEFVPPEVVASGNDDSQGMLDVAGPFMKLMAGLMGIQPDFNVQSRGLIGIEWSEDANRVVVQKVLADTPAATAGFKVGDQFETIAVTKPGKTTLGSTIDIDRPRDLARVMSRVAPGQKAQVIVKRGDESVTLKFTFGKGL